MSLATRCPACGTVFRVVQDQLKVSGGWVRCGQCHEVFNGLQALFELPAEPAPAPVPPPPPPPTPTAGPTAGLFVTRPSVAEVPNEWQATEPLGLDQAPAVDDSMVDLADPADEQDALIDPDAQADAKPGSRPWAYTPGLSADDPSEAETVLPEGDPDGDTVQPAATDLAPDLPSGGRDDALSAQVSNAAVGPSAEPAEPTKHAAPAAVAEPAAAAAPAEPPKPPADPTAQPEPAAADSEAPTRRNKRQRKPAFMRQAERAARWRTPAMRAVLGSTSVVLGLMLALQIAHQFRDDLAAHWPATRDALTAWCRVANCQLQAPRSLASITLDSSALSRTARPQVLRFDAELRNAADHAVLAPALDVSFTDNLGHPLVRKVLLPVQLAIPAEGLPANQTWHIEVPLHVGELPIAGFTAEVFYP